MSEAPLPVLLLHGQPGSPEDWARVRTRLGPVASLAPSRPGYGNNPLPASGFTANAQDALRSLDAAGHERAIVVGYSWSGGVAIRLAASAHDRVAGVLLVSSIGPGAVGTMDRLLVRPRLGPVLATGAALAGTVAMHHRARPLVERIVGIHRRDAGSSIFRRDGRGRIVATFLAEQRALVAQLPEILDDARTLTMPVTVLAARDDRTVPLRVATALAGTIPDCDLRVLARGGHTIPQREPAAVVAALDALRSRT